MTKLLDLAQRFEKQSEKEAESVSETVREALKQHEKDLQKQLQDVRVSLQKGFNSTLNDMERQRARLRWFWQTPMLIMSSVIILFMIGLFLITWQADKERKNMREWKASAAIYEKNSKGIKLSNCVMDKGPKRPCVQVDPKHIRQFWGEDKAPMMILPE